MDSSASGYACAFRSGVSSDQEVVVANEELASFVLGQLAELGQTFEVELAGRAGSKQHQDRGRLVGLIAEGVDAAGRDEEIVALLADGPVPTVEELDPAGEDEERFRHGLVEVRPGAARPGAEIDAIQAEVAAGRFFGGQVAVLDRADFEVGWGVGLPQG